MPIYNFKCKNEHITEDIVSNDIYKIECPICKDIAVRTFTMSNIGLSFKGNGFYINDYKKENTSSTG